MSSKHVYWNADRQANRDDERDKGLKIPEYRDAVESFYGPPFQSVMTDFDKEFIRRPIENVKSPTQNMMHVLDFRNDNIVQTLLNRPGHLAYWDDLVEEEINGVALCGFKTTQTDSQHIKGKNRIVIPNEDHSRWKEFIIVETNNIGGSVKEVYTVGSFTELAGYRVIDPGDLVDMTLSQMVDYALGDADWFKGVLEVDPSATMTIEQEDYTNPYKLLSRIAVLWGVELDFYIQIEDHRITGRYVDMRSSVGDWRGKEIVSGKDIVGVERTENAREIATAIKVIGPQQDREEDEDGNVDTERERLTVEVRNEEARMRWSRTGGHIWDIHEPETENQDITLERLETIGLIELNKRIAMKYNYEVEAISLENMIGYSHERVRLGDHVRIKDTRFRPALFMDARVIKIERSLTRASDKKFTLGDYVVYDDGELESIRREFKRRLERTERESARDAQRRADHVWTEAEKIWREAVLDIEDAKTRLGQAEEDLRDAEELLDQTDKKIDDEASRLEEYALEVSQEAYEDALQDAMDYIDNMDFDVELEDVNGISITNTDGFLAVRGDGLVRTIMNATDGFSIQSRNNPSSYWSNVLYADSDGDLMLAGSLIAQDGGVFDGHVMARGMELTGTLTANNATVTGTINGAGATFQSITARNARMVDTIIENATITANIIGGSIDIVTDARIGNNIYLGNQSDSTNKYLRFANDSAIRGRGNGDLEFMASNIIMEAESLNVSGEEVRFPQIVSRQPTGDQHGYFKRDNDNYIRIGGDGEVRFITGGRSTEAIRIRRGDVASANEMTLSTYSGTTLQGVTLHARTSRLEVLTSHSNHESRNYQEIRAREFNPQSSRTSKKDITPFQGDVLDTIRNTGTYMFRMTNDPGDMDKTYGFISEEMPELLTNQGALRLTSITSYLWEGIAQSDKKHDEKYDELKEKIKRLEERINA